MNDKTNNKNEYVELLLPHGHTVVIDVTNSIQQGLLDSDGMETTGDVLLAIGKWAKNPRDFHLLGTDGFPVLVGQAPVAIRYLSRDGS